MEGRGWEGDGSNMRQPERLNIRRDSIKKAREDGEGKRTTAGASFGGGVCIHRHGEDGKVDGKRRVKTRRHPPGRSSSAEKCLHAVQSCRVMPVHHATPAWRCVRQIQRWENVRKGCSLPVAFAQRLLARHAFPEVSLPRASCPQTIAASRVVHARLPAPVLASRITLALRLRDVTAVRTTKKRCWEWSRSFVPVSRRRSRPESPCTPTPPLRSRTVSRYRR